MAKRKRETWPSSELVHIWANQGEERGRARGTPLEFEGPAMLLRLVERVRMGGVGYKVEPGDGEKHKFGYYKLSEITKDGDVRIGCHYITWPVIEEFRPRLMRIWETVGGKEGEE